MEERKFEEIEKVGMGMKKRRFGAEGEDEGLVIMWQGGFEGKDWSAASYMGLEEMNFRCMSLEGDCGMCECREDLGINGALFNSKVETVWFS